MKSRKEGRSSSAEETLAALLDRPFLDYAVHLSRRHRFLYVVNPKVGCSSILWTLRRFESGDTETVPQKVGTIHDRTHSPLLRPSDLQAGPELLQSSELFKFTFVRNPFDRLLSCYQNKIQRPTTQRRLLLGLMGRSPDDEAAVSLEEFLEAIAEQAPAEMDPHWRPQWAQTLQDATSYDAIGRFEDFDSELLRIGELISPTFKDHVYQEKRQATGSKPYHLLSPEMVELLHDIYGRDFEEFGYPLEIPAP